MGYPFVAAPDHWSRDGVPILAIVIHHAEGGGTVSWLTRPDGNSSHYVVEYTGRVVQMVREDRAAGSINPTLVRLGDDAPFDYLGETVTYGATANKAALGEHWRNPNAAVIAIEVEGFARDGPNEKQRSALVDLVGDIRTRYPGLPTLGHRDFQNYKACPGKRIPWVDYGGHGTPKESDVRFIQASGLTATPSSRLLRLPQGTPLYGFDGSEVTRTSTARDWSYVGLVDAHSGEYVISAGTGKPYPDGVTRPTLLVARTGTLVDAPAQDCTDEVAAAIAADRAKAKVIWE